ncbi:hypothetical protein FIBSPDRAFT_867461 [Athelia psychrophila]|uniref:Uncharacterized protein n=1 Tax=Athelia psychrophila TaxID=1759441 RepID=A0A166DXZ9_9AGAM|nr:hypothetical protein FIBSPDRAFT_867461 [Fibularhizoctonia sp. CBS 109695]
MATNAPSNRQRRCWRASALEGTHMFSQWTWRLTRTPGDKAKRSKSARLTDE